MASGRIQVDQAFPLLTFERPLDIQDPRDGTNRLFVVEQGALIKVFKNTAQTAEVKVFLDIRDRVDADGNEQGLLGLAFDPDFKHNGYFYVNYTAPGPPVHTVVSRFQVDSQDPDRALKDTEFILLTFDQPYSNHNGGQVSFGPDGFLYIATGDGGAAGDPHGNGQSLKTFLGKVLRIDVRATMDGPPYRIPPDNPFAGNVLGYKEEIYAYGLRNPWRFSWGPDGKFWVADVGQNEVEEVDIVEKGKNYGWNIMEGDACYQPKMGCPKTGLEMPVTHYRRSEGRCVTGGFVYRGARYPSLRGKYIFADFVSGVIWTLEPGLIGWSRKVLIKTALNISSFGEDTAGELYLCGFDGKIYTFGTA